MKFPKLLDGPNAVGEAKARHLETIDAPFLTAIGPGFVASKKGPTSEVTGVVKQEQVVEDGWFSTTEPPYPAVAILYATDNPKHRFRRKGSFANVTTGTPVFSSGKGWGFVIDGELDNPSTGYTLFSIYKTINSRRGSTDLIHVIALYSIAEYKAEIYGNFYTLNSGPHSPALCIAGAWLATRSDGVQRQDPRFRIISEASPGAWAETEYDFSSLIVDSESYTYPEFACLLPGTHLVAFAAFGDQYPTMCVTDDYGSTWSTLPSLPDIYPLRGTWTFDTRAAIQAANPSWTGQQVETYFLQQTGVSELGWAAHIYIYPIAADRVLVQARYLKATVPHTPMSAISLIDPYSGDLKWQKYSTHPNEAQYMDCFACGFGTWIVFLWDTTQTYVDTLYLIEDFGASETTLTTPPNLFNIGHGVCPVVNKHSAGPENDSPPTIYFIVDELPHRVLYATDDWFVTTKRQSIIGDPSTARDFLSVQWIGNRRNKAPIDPTFPWRTDDRVSVPDWWVNVSAYGG